MAESMTGVPIKDLAATAASFSAASNTVLNYQNQAAVVDAFQAAMAPDIRRSGRQRYHRDELLTLAHVQTRHGPINNVTTRLVTATGQCLLLPISMLCKDKKDGFNTCRSSVAYILCASIVCHLPGACIFKILCYPSAVLREDCQVSYLHIQ